MFWTGRWWASMGKEKHRMKAIKSRIKNVTQGDEDDLTLTAKSSRFHSAT